MEKWKKIKEKSHWIGRIKIFCFLSILPIITRMRLIYRIPTITGIILILTALVNILAFQYFSDKYFAPYIDDLTATTEDTPDPARIQALLQIGKLNQKDQREYLAIFSELANLSESISNISKNPELYMSNRAVSWDSMISIPFFDKKNSNFLWFNFRSIGDDTPEGRFTTSILTGILFTNIVWVFLILVGYLFWIQSIFRPIGIVTDTIEKILHKKRYVSIRYTGNNEFTPLISTINTLHKTLSIQEKIRSDFLSDLSHEIRTPITAVKCYLEWIEDGVIKLDQKTISLLQTELTRLATITEKIMEYEHLTHDIFSDVRVERFDVRDIINQIIEEYRPQLLKTHQSIRIVFPEEEFLISMDKSMCIQILHNIFSNFLKYAGKNTKLNINIDRWNEMYIFTFEDDGVGVPVEELAFVKEKFYRVDKWRNQDENRSMGIWLSIIDTVARLHHGSCVIEKWEKWGFRVKVMIKR